MADDAGSTVVPASFAGVRQLADALREACRREAVGEEGAIDLELALVEAANNVVEHGYAGREDGWIGLAISVADGRVRLVVEDGGSPVPPDALAGGAEPALDAIGGRGTGIMRACVDELLYETRGETNRLTLIRRC